MLNHCKWIADAML
jgi:hypothetical protein